MTSRERVRKALRHEEPDRVPFDIGAFTNIHVDEYCMLVRSLGIEQLFLPPRCEAVFDYHAAPDVPVLDWFGSDFIGLYNPIDKFGFPVRDMHIWKNHAGNDILIAGSICPEKDERGYTVIRDKCGKVILEMAPESDCFDRPVNTSFSEDIEYTDLKEFRASLPPLSDEELRDLEMRAKFLYENTERSIFGTFSDQALWSPGGLLAGHNFADWMVIMMTEQEYCAEILGIFTEWYLGKLEGYLQAVGGYIDALLMSTADFGSQKAPFFSPELFRKLYLPCYKEMNAFVHRHSAAKTFYHSCGAVASFFLDFIEAGVDIVNPIQTGAAGMDPAELKRLYGDRLVLWGGGMDTQKVLPYASPEEVRETVKERMEILKKGGGYVFTTEHCIQSDVPFENLAALKDAVREYGAY